MKITPIEERDPTELELDRITYKSNFDKELPDESRREWEGFFKMKMCLQEELENITDPIHRKIFERTILSIKEKMFEWDDKIHVKKFGNWPIKKK